MNNHSLFYEIIRIYGRTALRLIRRHKRCSSKLARYTNHLTFLTRCIKNRVVPKDLQVRPPGERIRLTQKAEGDAKKETESTAQSITSTLSTNDANRILEQIETNTQQVFNTTKDRHKQKFEKLIREKQAAVSPVDTPYVDKTNWVINLSSRSLSDADITLLKKELNFAVTPANIPDTEIIAKVETAVRQLDAEQADTVRRAVNGILQQAELPEPNITKEMRDALKSLKEDQSIMVLPAEWILTPTELRCLHLLRTERTSSSTKIRQTVLPASCRKNNQSQQSTIDHAWPVDFIAWRTLAACSRNVAIYITRDYIVRQTENLAFINYQLLVINRRSSIARAKRKAEVIRLAFPHSSFPLIYTESHRKNFLLYMETFFAHFDFGAWDWIFVKSAVKFSEHKHFPLSSSRLGR